MANLDKFRLEIDLALSETKKRYNELTEIKSVTNYLINKGDSWKQYRFASLKVGEFALIGLTNSQFLAKYTGWSFVHCITKEDYDPKDVLIWM